PVAVEDRQDEVAVFTLRFRCVNFEAKPEVEKAFCTRAVENQIVKRREKCRARMPLAVSEAVYQWHVSLVNVPLARPYCSITTYPRGNDVAFLHQCLQHAVQTRVAPARKVISNLFGGGYAQRSQRALGRATHHLRRRQTLARRPFGQATLGQVPKSSSPCTACHHDATGGPQNVHHALDVLVGRPATRFPGDLRAV